MALRAFSRGALGRELSLDPSEGLNVHDRLVFPVVLDALPDEATDVEGVAQDLREVLPLDRFGVALGSRHTAQPALLERLGQLAKRVVT
ncbi:MAG: hypothetical protein KGL23_05215 [Acidobacteriota bacterium]|nr:hypothetical protein [Acidobacteriota bacterium]MDE3146814.1 hypothetical protein [Acidobacteriota bacterium]